MTRRRSPGCGSSCLRGFERIFFVQLSCCLYVQGVIEQRILEIEREMQSLETVRGTIVIKKIRGKLYYYNQWKEDGKRHSKSLGAVRPGSIARQEEAIKKANERLRERSLLSDFTFEVYWKDEITARVYVKGADVVVARYTDHPVRQLFAKARMTRLQLNRIFRSRCWEEGRPDNRELLNAIGLEHYDPQKIVQRTHGVSYNDFIWFRFPGEKLTSQDVLVR